ncbi:CPK2 [Symbiodinium necroappetens]|uniref:CPK2 protein n=1 Tax=Symbiodinium necroappetens TaxID=1628268 RepID=A0A812IUF5_9DINO|nr:CPK2 [Symbiodinium necroappetens]
MAALTGAIYLQFTQLEGYDFMTDLQQNTARENLSGYHMRPGASKSPQATPPASPARSLPGTLLPLTGLRSSSPCVSPSKGTVPSPPKSPQATPSFDLKALIPDHLDEDIFARYDFDDKELGAGGFGSVYLAKDRKMADREVAIKKAVMLDGDMRQNFQQEVRIMKELDHPNICRVYESYDHGRHVFFVMEFCAGGDLFDRILRQGGLSEAEAAEILRQVAGALKHAHEKGVAHRDLKPENVCFCSEDMQDTRVKVIDWGLGFYFRRSRMNTAVGSGAYAAPEVQCPVGGGAYTSACDLWSLGAMACVMLSGEPPNYGGNAFDEQRDFAPHGPIWEKMSSDARSLVTSLLKWDPSQRPSADQVLNHAWLRTYDEQPSIMSSKTEVLKNLRRFSNNSTFLSLCAASVAQQLSRRGLKELEQVFKELDANGDGILELHEVRAGFQQILGRGSAPLEEIEEMFSRLDIDGSGAIDYTEFLAAGLGNRVNSEVEALWAAFKAFDVHESDGNITEVEGLEGVDDNHHHPARTSTTTTAIAIAYVIGTIIIIIIIMTGTIIIIIMTGTTIIIIMTGTTIIIIMTGTIIIIIIMTGTIIIIMTGTTIIIIMTGTIIIIIIMTGTTIIIIMTGTIITIIVAFISTTMRAEIAHVLFEAGAGRVWSAEKCQELAREVVQQFDRDGNGSLDFDEWLEMMKRLGAEMRLQGMSSPILKPT